MRAQQEAAFDLLRAGYSGQGYSKVETIRQLEIVLFEMSGHAIAGPGAVLLHGVRRAV